MFVTHPGVSPVTSHGATSIRGCVRLATAWCSLCSRGEGVRFDIHPAQELTPDAVLGNFRRGYAQILKRLADWPSLQGLVHHLGRVFHAAVQVNAFLTPAGARTHPTYTANDDILVLQVEGEAVWRLHELSLLQLDLSQKRNLEFPAEWQHRTETPVLAEVRLRPGDLLFIPRGMPHFATTPDHPTLHLSIYITPLFWTDFLKIAAEYAAVHSQELRRALPPRLRRQRRDLGAHAEHLSAGDAGFREVSFDGVLAAVKRNRVALQGFPCEGQLATLARAEEITVDSEVERRPDVLCTLERCLTPRETPKHPLLRRRTAQRSAAPSPGAGARSGPRPLPRLRDPRPGREGTTGAGAPPDRRGAVRPSQATESANGGAALTGRNRGRLPLPGGRTARSISSI